MAGVIGYVFRVLPWRRGGLLGSAAFWLSLFSLAVAAMACGGDAPAGQSRSDDGAASPAATTAAAYIPGDAPQISAETYEHGTFDLAELGGQPVVINFWFPSCPPCRAEMPDLQAAYDEFKDRGLHFLGVQQLGLDTEDSGREFLEEVGVDYPNIGDADGKVQVAYRVLSYPTTVFLDREHNIARVWSGLIDEEQLREQILKILEG